MYFLYLFMYTYLSYYYIAGLPTETTEEDFVELMSKCGIIMEDDEGIVICSSPISLARLGSCT